MDIYIESNNIYKGFCGVHNAIHADQGNRVWARTFWKVQRATDRVAVKCDVRAEFFPANQQSVILQNSVEHI